MMTSKGVREGQTMTDQAAAIPRYWVRKEEVCQIPALLLPSVDRDKCDEVVKYADHVQALARVWKEAAKKHSELCLRENMGAKAFMQYCEQ